MAMDQAMLEYAAATQHIVLRIYQWSNPTISLGYFQAFQAYQALADYPDLSSLDCVRRLTGGGAILHDQEVTYSVAVPGDGQPKGHSEKLYRAVHRAIVVWLETSGFHARLWEEANATSAMAYSKEASFWCFERRSDVDIVVDDRKVLGSAQRRTATGLLQHGSLLVKGSRWLPKLPGLFSKSPTESLAEIEKELTARKFGEVVKSALEKAVGCEWSDGHANAAVCERASVVDTERFSSLEWTRSKNRHLG